MPNNIEELITKIEGLPKFVKESASDFIEFNQNDIVNKNREQMLSGLDSNANSLGQYSRKSAEIRKKKRLQIDHIDLRDTGEFHQSITLNALDVGKFEITATDEKWENELAPQKRFEDALGLTPENEDNLTDNIIKYIDSEINEYL